MNKYLYVLLLFSFTSIFGQIETFDPNTPVTIPQKSTESSFRPLVALSINPSLMVMGMFGLHAEVGLTDKFSLCVGGGITTRDYKYEIFRTSGMFGSGRQNKTNFTSYSSINSSRPAFGKFFDAQLKFFPNGHDDLEGLYFGPDFRYRNYIEDKSIYESTDGRFAIYESVEFTKAVSMPLGYSMFDAIFKIGYLNESEIYDNLVGDIYFGLGYSMLKRNVYEEVYGDSNANYEPTLKFGTQTVDRIIPVWGISIGYLISR
jgi:hypothetical protein